MNNNNEIRYETKELGPPICDESNKIEIDKMMLNECFFSELDLDDERREPLMTFSMR